MADLEEALQIARQAVNATPEGHPDRAERLKQLGAGLIKRFRRTRAVADLKEAIVHFQSALCQANAPTTTRIQAGHAALLGCTITSDWQRAYEVSNTAVPLIPKVTLRSLENSDKQHVLRQFVGLASDAAAVALQAGKGALVALRFLEQGRGVLATSLQDMRTDILSLRERHPELAARFVRLRDELDLPLTRDFPIQDAKYQPPQPVQASKRYDAGNELDKLVLEIRERPGFEDFLTSPGEGEMRAAARFGPIIVINVSKYRCDAILIEEHRVRFLTLPCLHKKDIEKMQRGDLGTLTVLEWLWDVAAKPILDTLGFTQPPTHHDWPRIWWIPTGPLIKFPLHAAGHHTGRSAETVMDRVISSYSPSVKTITHGRRGRVTSSTSGQALLVAMQDTPEYSRLPFAAEEVDMLRGLCRAMALDPIEPRRCKQDVTSHLLNCKIFHFAGHGYTDPGDPSQSHLLLEDWKSDPLTVGTLLDTNLRERSPFLAYLSACGTGQIKDEKVVDESIHLISAFQLAGFRHVIGTLWEVNDESCVAMSRVTYEEIRNGGMTDESVCRGLHRAARELRQRWLTESKMTGHDRRALRDVAIAEVENNLEAMSVDDRGGQGGGRLPRDVVCDDDDDEGIRPLHWVPYVHFGV